MNMWRVGEDMGSKEMDRCPLTGERRGKEMDKCPLTQPTAFQLYFQHKFCRSPHLLWKVTIYSSTVATFHAPSDISGIGNMHHKCIHTVKSWQKGPGRYNTIFVNTDLSMDSMQGLEVTRVCPFVSFSHEGVKYPCALVYWLSHVGD
jgi:hypothetical protein